MAMGLRDQVGRVSHVANIAGGKVTLYSRNGKIISESYVTSQRPRKGKGRRRARRRTRCARCTRHFALPAPPECAAVGGALLYCVFDVMFAGGEDLRDLPLLERKKRLRTILPKHPLLISANTRLSRARDCSRRHKKHGLEGIMAKRAASRYLSGARTGLAQDQDCQAAGGSHRRLHGSEAVTPEFWSAGFGRARQGRVALYRPCRHRLLACHAGATPREALETANIIVTVCRACMNG